MIVSCLLSATLTFTATATGVEKGTAIEFLFAGPNTDRAYESMFVLDEPVEALCRRIEEVAPRGVPVDAPTRRLWPTGCRVRFDPSFDRFVESEQPEGERALKPVYTGGSRHPDGTPEAAETMPGSFFSTYSLAQSPIVFDTPLDQGAAYGRFKAAVTLEKGRRFSFQLTVDERSLPPKIDLVAEHGNLKHLLFRLQAASASNDVDVSVSFADALTLEKSVAIAQALSVIDSSRVKINGPGKGLFYRAFLPLEKWRDRQERLHQPFELTLRDDGSDTLLFIDEDWSVEGNDPRLTPRQISYAQASQFTETDTCFIYANKTQTVSRVSKAIDRLSQSSVRNYYVFLVE